MIKDITKNICRRLLHARYTAGLVEFFGYFLVWSGKYETINVTKQEDMKVYVCITADTESGFVKKNGSRVWQYMQPRATQGCRAGIGNLQLIMKKYAVPITFLVCPHCLAIGGIKTRNLLKKVIMNEGEVGLHLHPESDVTLQKMMGKKISITSAHLIKQDLKETLVYEGRHILSRYLGLSLNNISSFRWGNWGLDNGGVSAIKNAGLSVDSSACPGIKGHVKDGRYYDWSKCTQLLPWYLDEKDYQAPDKNINEGVLEIPITTFKLGWKCVRADPALGPLMKVAFDKYYKRALANNEVFFFVIITHSSEMTMKNGHVTAEWKALDEFVKYASKKKLVRFITLNKIKKVLERCG